MDHLSHVLMWPTPRGTPILSSMRLFHLDQKLGSKKGPRLGALLVQAPGCALQKVTFLVLPLPHIAHHGAGSLPHVPAGRPLQPIRPDVGLPAWLAAAGAIRPGRRRPAAPAGHPAGHPWCVQPDIRKLHLWNANRRWAHNCLCGEIHMTMLCWCRDGQACCTCNNRMLAQP